MIYFELLQEYKRYCTQEELETLVEMDRATAPIFTPLLNWHGDVVTTIRTPYV